MANTSRPSPKGRPPTDPAERLSTLLTIRVTPAEFAAVTERCAAIGLSQSAYLRTILLQGHASVRARVAKVNLAVAADIRRMADALTRLAAYQAQIQGPQWLDLADHLHQVMRRVANDLRGGGQ